MELYFTISCVVCARPEKGATVIAVEHLVERYQDMSGFSPQEPAADAGVLPYIHRYTGNPSAGYENWLDAECSYYGGQN